MTHPMTCERFADSLADLLDREIAEPDRTSMEAHAVACQDCGPLLADLRKLRVDAANLPELVPSRDLWSGIEARIATPVIDLQGSAIKRDTRLGWTDDSNQQRRKRWATVGLAAAALIVVTAGVTHVLTKRAIVGAAATRLATVPDSMSLTAGSRRTDRVLPGSAAQPAIDSANLASSKFLPASHPVAAGAETYDREIARLRAVLNQRSTQLDPLTVGVIERNLLVIDDAIAQCRQALRKDPASRFLMQSLNDELENKVELLRRATALPLRTS